MKEETKERLRDWYDTLEYSVSMILITALGYFILFLLGTK